MVQEPWFKCIDLFWLCSISHLNTGFWILFWLLHRSGFSFDAWFHTDRSRPKVASYHWTRIHWDEHLKFVGPVVSYRLSGRIRTATTMALPLCMCHCHYYCSVLATNPTRNNHNTQETITILGYIFFYSLLFPTWAQGYVVYVIYVIYKVKRLNLFCTV